MDEESLLREICRRVDIALTNVDTPQGAEWHHALANGQSGAPAEGARACTPPCMSVDAHPGFHAGRRRVG